MSVVVLLWAVMDPLNLCSEEGRLWEEEENRYLVSSPV